MRIKAIWRLAIKDQNKPITMIIDTKQIIQLSKSDNLDTYGKPVTFCNGMIDSLTATKYRMAQYDTN